MKSWFKVRCESSGEVLQIYGTLVQKENKTFIKGYVGEDSDTYTTVEVDLKTLVHLGENIENLDKEIGNFISQSEIEDTVSWVFSEDWDTTAFS